jgi:hypothetical protein
VFILDILVWNIPELIWFADLCGVEAVGMDISHCVG